jgi:hypothetical protein
MPNTSIKDAKHLNKNNIISHQPPKMNTHTTQIVRAQNALAIVPIAAPTHV